MQDVIDVIVTKTVNRISAVKGQGDNPTFDFTVTLTAASGSVVVNPNLIDTFSSGLAMLGVFQSNGKLRPSETLRSPCCGSYQTKMVPGPTCILPLNNQAVQELTLWGVSVSSCLTAAAVNTVTLELLSPAANRHLQWLLTTS